MVDATLIAEPSSTKNTSGRRDPEMHQSKKGQQWHFGMKAHIGVDTEPGLVRTVRGTVGNVNDVLEANALLHGQASSAYGDACYQRAVKRPDAKSAGRWTWMTRWTNPVTGLRRSTPAFERRSSIRFGCSIASSAM